MSFDLYNHEYLVCNEPPIIKVPTILNPSRSPSIDRKVSTSQRKYHIRAKEDLYIMFQNLYH
ncbi:hypothetical protein OMCYN_01232 [cyanobiont of Ornithocercus magnificus]|nr:hypothetical protein OMCYN_01232 [cyanobiont of Ornithocercus magnificus]